MNTAEIIKWGRWRIAWVTRNNCDAVGKLLSAGDVDGVGLSPHHGFDGDTALLSHLPSFAGLVVTEGDTIDYQQIPRFNELKFVSLGGMRSRGFDFSGFVDLVDFRIASHPSDVLPKSEIPLESLYLKGYKPKTKDLRELPAYGCLDRLELVQAGVTSLDGVQRFIRLRDIDVSYCKTLDTISALASTLVERVHFESCGRIADIPVLAKCSRLRSIRLSSCGSLQSLAFLNDSKTIEEFRFVKMEVLDRDMTPLLRLRSVGFINKQGYSHTCEEVKEAIVK
jgi:hypothetical protein